MSTNTRSTNARSAIAPCGHPGHHVIGQYVECDQKCHTKVSEIGATPAFLSCPSCTSFEIAPFDEVSMAGYLNVWHCWKCGAVWGTNP